LTSTPLVCKAYLASELMESPPCLRSHSTVTCFFMQNSKPHISHLTDATPSQM
jgi:hypothetical protein